MVKRDVEASLLPICRRHQVSHAQLLVAGARSAFRAASDRTAQFQGDDQRRDNPRFSVGNRNKVAALMADIAPVVEAHKATPAQIVIAWTLQQPGITFSLCGARNPAQARENAAAGRIRLSSSEINTISEAASRHLTNLDA